MQPERYSRLERLLNQNGITVKIQFDSKPQFFSRFFARGGVAFKLLWIAKECFGSGGCGGCGGFGGGAGGGRKDQLMDNSFCSQN